MAACGWLDDNKYSDDEKTRGKDVIFCGNPGVGKSTLLSSITGENFKSGVSWAKGLTTELEWKAIRNIPGFRFADTPGLADIDMKKQAGEAITKALTSAKKENHDVLLFFVVNDTNGRTRTEDLYTIRSVLDSIEVEGGRKNNLYSVIVNQMDCLEMPGWKEEGEPMWKAQFFRSSPTVPYPTTSIIFLPRVKELVNKSNGTYDFEGLGGFLLGSPSLSITSVKKIEVGDMREQMKKLRKLHQEGIKKLQEKMKNDKEQWERELSYLRSIERERRERLEQDLKERAQEIRDLRDKQNNTDTVDLLLKMRDEDKKRYDKMVKENAERQQEMNKQLAAISSRPQRSKGILETLVDGVVSIFR